MTGNGCGRGLNADPFDATMRIMPLKDPSFTIGIEEEYLLVDLASRDLVREMPQALFDAAQQALQGQVAREFLKSQIEVGTGVHNSPRDAGGNWPDLRATVAKLAASTGSPRSPPPRTPSRAGARRSRPSATATRRSPATSPASAGASSSAACTCTSASRTTSCAST